MCVCNMYVCKYISTHVLNAATCYLSQYLINAYFFSISLKKQRVWFVYVVTCLSYKHASLAMFFASHRFRAVA